MSAASRTARRSLAAKKHAQTHTSHGASGDRRRRRSHARDSFDRGHRRTGRGAASRTRSSRRAEGLQSCEHGERAAGRTAITQAGTPPVVDCAETRAMAPSRAGMVKRMLGETADRTTSAGSEAKAAQRGKSVSGDDASRIRLCDRRLASEVSGVMGSRRLPRAGLADSTNFACSLALSGRLRACRTRVRVPPDYGSVSRRAQVPTRIELHPDSTGRRT